MSDNEPTSVKDILIEMKTLSEICVDLAFASLLYSDKLVAEQVLVLEEKIDSLHKLLLDRLSVSIKTLNQAEDLRIYYIIGEANNLISDSAADMASLVLMDINIEDEIRTVQQHMDQIVDLVELKSNSVLCGKSELSADLHDLIGIDVAAIRCPVYLFHGLRDQRQSLPIYRLPPAHQPRGLHFADKPVDRHAHPR